MGAVLLLLVFCIKAAVLPLHFWLPASYANAPLPVAALFAIMTKVGAYSILRMYTLGFGPEVEATQGLVGAWLQPAALVTLAVGAIGILGTQHIARMVAFCAIASMGTLLIAISLFTETQATAAALYYIYHSTLATALLFLVADLVMERRGGAIEPKSTDAAKRSDLGPVLCRRHRVGRYAAAVGLCRQAAGARCLARGAGCEMGLGRDPDRVLRHHRRTGARRIVDLLEKPRCIDTGR